MGFNGRLFNKVVVSTDPRHCNSLEKLPELVVKGDYFYAGIAALLEELKGIVPRNAFLNARTYILPMTSLRTTSGDKLVHEIIMFTYCATTGYWTGTMVMAKV